MFPLRLLFLSLSLCLFGLHAETIEAVLAAKEAPREVVYKEIDSHKLLLHIFAPPNPKKDDQHAALVVIHGGGWSRGKADIHYAHCRYLARRGIVAIAIDYRLTTNGLGINDCLVDCRDALRWIAGHAQELAIDPTRIAIMGESAGGHLAAGVALITDDQPTIPIAALCLFNPVVDIAGLSWWKGVPGITMDGVDPHDPRHPAQVLSPITHIRAALPPTLIVHGTEDTTVPFAQAEQFTKQMEAAGNRCDLIPLAGVGHAFLLPGYGSPATIAEGVIALDQFLTELGLLSGAPTLEAVAAPSESKP